MKKIVFIISSVVMFLLAFSFDSRLVLADGFELEINDNSFQEDIELEKEIEKLLESAPELEAPIEDGVSTFMTSSSYKPRAGDILYTPSTQCKDNKDKCKGITGHVGIVSSTGSNVYHIRGLNSKPSSIGKSTWFNNYKKTLIIRPGSKSNGQKAADWVYKHYIKGTGKNKSYKVTLSRSVNLKTTYCSLIPWHGYVHGANHYMGGTSGYLMPSNLITNANANGFTVHGKVGY